MGERAFICVLTLGMAMLSSPVVHGVEYGVSFSGDLAYAYPVYGQTVPGLSDVVARLVYDTETVATYELGGCDCATYRQRIYNGFSVSFGELALRADEYDIHVINNFGPDGGSDFIRIVFSSNNNPPFETPLVVNGVPQATGQLVISLRDPGGAAIDGSTLPDLADLSRFQTYEALLRESPAQSEYLVAANLHSPELLVLAIGDFDFDADVDGADFLEWQRNVGATLPSPADGDRNGVVDSGDLALWDEHFGESLLSTLTSISIAEPTACSLALSLIAVTMFLRSTRSR